MTRHLRILAAGLALALTPLAPAHADSGFTHDCGYDSIAQQQLTGSQNHYEGIAYVATALYSNDHGNVVNANVTCEVRINGVPRTSTTFWGSGVVVGAGWIEFDAEDVDDVRLCTIVDYTSDDTPTQELCPYATTTQFPPQYTLDLIGAVLDWFNYWVYGPVDPIVCAQFQALAPGTSPVTVDDDDMYVNGELFWDCPPYEDGYQPPDSQPLLPVVPPEPGQPAYPDPTTVNGGGYNTGDAGFLALSGERTASTCAYAKDPAAGIKVVGTTVTQDAASSRVRCRLLDTATGAVLYDDSTDASAPFAVLAATVPAHAGPVTVCTEGAGTWPDHEVTLGLHCRPGEPLDRLVP